MSSTQSDSPKPEDTKRFSLPVSARLLRADSEALIIAVAILVVIIIVVAFLPSFEAQSGLAIDAGIPVNVAFSWPLVVDGTIVVSVLAAVLLRSRSAWAKRSYPWAVLVLFTGISVWTNGTKSANVELTHEVRFFIGAVPPIGIAICVHLLTLILEANVVVTDVEERVVHDPNAEASAPEEAAAPPQTKRRATSVQVEAWIRRRLDAGELPTRKDVGERLGKSTRTGQRFLQDVLRDDEGAAAQARALEVPAVRRVVDL